MNKQWLISRLQASIEYQESVPTTDYHIGKRAGYIGALRLTKKLDEPQNPVVPCSVGSLIEFYREKGVTLKHILNCFNEWADTDNEHTDEVNWIVSNPETFMRAWLDGYEVEKEPTWVVKRSDGTIVTQFSLWGLNGEGWSFDTDHPNPLIFTNKAKADAVAVLVSGEVIEG
ncbi:DUF1642 domain-containing protein [Enterococcus thailandicus]|uniref:DUF1642 domain-containing protein n=1 Tax=Enterococcus thailandicus TaxID=417368 RepID=UPI0034DD5EA9